MTILDALAVFGRLHPLLLHLPIGLVAGVALLEAVALVRPRLALRPAVSILLWCAALVAAISAGTGWILAGEASYGGDTLELHRWLGLSLAGVVFVTAIVQSRAKPPAFYRVGLVLALALLIPAGHFGGELTRGPGFVLEPLASKRPRTPTAMVAMDIQRTVFEATIRPTLDATCVACHNEQKRKAGLSLVDGESIMAGSENGEVVVAGDVANSELVRRLRLPLDDDDHMPPEGKRQPSEAEIAAIETWIMDGASFSATTSTSTVDVAALVPQLRKATTRTPAQPSSEPAARPDDLLALQAAFVHVELVAPGSSYLLVDFAGPANSQLADDAFVARLLQPLVLVVQDLSLAGSGVTDATLEVVATMTNLRRLDLRATAVTDAGLGKLGGLAKLEELNLVRTATSDASVDTLLAFPALCRAFLWSTAVTTQGLERLRTARPALLVDAGDTADSAALDIEPPVELAVSYTHLTLPTNREV